MKNYRNQVLGANDYCECGGIVNSPSGTGCSRDCGRHYETVQHLPIDDEAIELPSHVGVIDRDYLVSVATESVIRTANKLGRTVSDEEATIIAEMFCTGQHDAGSFLIEDYTEYALDNNLAEV